MGHVRIAIRPLRLSDTYDIYEVMNMPNVLWSTPFLPSSSPDQWNKTVETWVYDSRTHVFTAELQGKVVGLASLVVGEGRTSHIGSLLMAVHDQHQGQGIGKMLMLTSLDLADNWLNLLRLELDVPTDNEKALRLYNSFNFSIEGRKRHSIFRAGTYIDSYLMARIRASQQDLTFQAEASAQHQSSASPAQSSEPTEPI